MTDANLSPAEGEPSGKQRRTLAGKLVNPKEQLLIGGRMVAVGFLNAVIGFYIAWRAASGDLDAFLKMGVLQPESYQALRSSFAWSLGYVGLDLVLIFFAIIAFGAWISHGIYGPMIPIRRQVRKLIEGHYEGEIKLRKDDSFHDLAKDLNELTEALRNRAPK